MSIIQTSSPFLRSFDHSDATVDTTFTQVLDPLPAGRKRIITLIQNQSSTATITVVFNTTGTSGIVLQPATFFSIDNYGGAVRVSASTSGTPVHVAVSEV